MKKIKVCHFTSVHPATDGRIFEKECTTLACAGYDLYLVAPNAEEREINGVKIINVPIVFQSRIKRFFSISKNVYKKALSLNADIYHFHDPELLPYGLKLKRKGKKVIFDSHEFYGFQIREKKYIPYLLRTMISKIYMKYEAFVCKQIDAVIQVCTIEDIDYFEKRCMKSIFLANYPELELQSNKQVEKDNTVIHVGGLTYERGITHLVKAAELSDIKIKLAGKFYPSNYLDELKEMGGFKSVCYLGFLDKKRLKEEIGMCVAGISTLLNVGQYNKIDTLPTKIYEYMSEGVPIVLSDTPYNRQLNEKYNFGICVEPDKPQQIADAINYIINHPQEANIMGENGRNLVIKKFNWELEKEKLLSLYKEILNDY